MSVDRGGGGMRIDHANKSWETGTRRLIVHLFVLNLLIVDPFIVNLCISITRMLSRALRGCPDPHYRAVNAYETYIMHNVMFPRLKNHRFTSTF